jgi:hypothetical protein
METKMTKQSASKMDLNWITDDQNANLIAVENHHHVANHLRNDYIRETVKFWWAAVQNLGGYELPTKLPSA